MVALPNGESSMRSSPLSFGIAAAALGLIVAAHLILDPSSEPFFNNDETRHVMTGVFFRDLLHDQPFEAPRDYAEQYYLQYPALGLLVWPPLFHFAEGMVMTVLGPSFGTARLTLAIFGLIAGVYCYRLFRRFLPAETAAVGVLLVGATPLVFIYSRYVMAEVPTLAFVLMSLFYFERYLQTERKFDAIGCCLAAAFAALTRFDGIVLLPYVLLRLWMARRFSLLLRWPVLVGVGLALLLTVPFYYLALSEYGSAIGKAAAEGTSAESTSLFALGNLFYYPSTIPNQIGWGLTFFAGLGLAGMATKQGRERLQIPVALILSTYVMFTPFAELEERHAIYWIPALVLLALEGVRYFQTWFKWRFARAVLLGLLCLLTAIDTARHRARNWCVFGYEDAAKYVLRHNRETPVCLMDGFLNGGFIYYTRLHDPERKLWVLRGDKVFYSVLSDPSGGYEERVNSREGILDLIYRFDPELIVLEEPEIYFSLPVARLLRETIRNHPERFVLVERIPIRTNHHHFEGHELLIYRNLKRNPDRNQHIEIEMMNLQRSLKVKMKDR